MKAIKILNNGSTVELNNEELANVVGGFRDYEVTETRYDLAAGDTFKKGDRYYRVEDDLTGITIDTSITCRCFIFDEKIGKYKQIKVYISYSLELVLNGTYIGNNVITNENVAWFE